MTTENNKNTITLSDDKIFYTIEGEGKYIGMPSVFMRMSGCNLTCKGFISKDSPHGCDSYVSWSVQNKMTFDEIFDLMHAVDDDCGVSVINHLRHGAILKLTGGEPLLQQRKLLEFIKQYKERYHYIPRIDFETNGTIMPDDLWIAYGATFTVSPKLSNNGDPFKKRYQEKVLQFHADNKGSDFKFVVSPGDKAEDDLDEIVEKYLHKYNITADRVWLMPMCGSRQELIENSADVAKHCKMHGFNFSPRLQLLIWDMALKV